VQVELLPQGRGGDCAVLSGLAIGGQDEGGEADAGGRVAVQGGVAVQGAAVDPSHL
jgi:hypothetical protein